MRLSQLIITLPFKKIGDNEICEIGEFGASCFNNMTKETLNELTHIAEEEKKAKRRKAKKEQVKSSRLCTIL